MSCVFGSPSDKDRQTKRHKDYYYFAVMSMIIIKQEASVSCFCLVEFVDRKQVGGRLFEIRTSLIDKVKLLL